MSFKDIFTGNNSKAGFDLANANRAVAGSYNPRIKAGENSLATLIAEYQKMRETPDFLQNQLSANWAPSQYAQTQMKWLTNAMNNNAAATGMLGSAYAANTMGQGLQDILSQDQNKYIDRGMDVYGTGINGEEGINDMGYSAMMNKNNILTGANQMDYNQRVANTGADTGLLGQGLSLAGMFATGGKGGLGMLAGQAGKSMMPDLTSMFQAPQAGMPGASSMNAANGLWMDF